MTTKYMTQQEWEARGLVEEYISLNFNIKLKDLEMAKGKDSSFMLDKIPSFNKKVHESSLTFATKGDFTMVGVDYGSNVKTVSGLKFIYRDVNGYLYAGCPQCKSILPLNYFKSAEKNGDFKSYILNARKQEKETHVGECAICYQHNRQFGIDHLAVKTEQAEAPDEFFNIATPIEVPEHYEDQEHWDMHASLADEEVPAPVVENPVDLLSVEPPKDKTLSLEELENLTVETQEQLEFFVKALKDKRDELTALSDRKREEYRKANSISNKAKESLDSLKHLLTLNPKQLAELSPDIKSLLKKLSTSKGL